MLILDICGISFHAVIVFGLGKNLLFKSVLGHCGVIVKSNHISPTLRMKKSQLFFGQNLENPTIVAGICYASGAEQSFRKFPSLSHSVSFLLTS